MIKTTRGTRHSRRYFDDYLQDAANDRHADNPDDGFVIKGYVLDSEEASDEAVIGIVDQQFRRTKNLAA